VSLGTDSATDRILVTNTLLEVGVTSSALITASGFNAANDAFRLISGVTSATTVGGVLSSAGYQALNAGGNVTVSVPLKGVIEIENSNIAAFDDTAAGNAETAIVAALGTITDPGTAAGGDYTVVLYSGADAGIYHMNVANTTTGVTAATDITIELVAVLTGVGVNALTSLNFF
jgi:hypothetical protein